MNKIISFVSLFFNKIAATSVAAMMLLTCADVIMRIFRFPIPGTYEIVGFLGAVFVSFSLAQTSLDHGHIAVDFFVKEMPATVQRYLFSINTLICAVLFSLATFHSFIYARDLQVAGEVSMTLQVPVCPFVYGTSLGCGMLSIVLFMQFLELLLKGENS